MTQLETHDDDEWIDDESDDDDDLLECPSCRREVHEDTQQCPNCGDWIEPVYPHRPVRKVVGVAVVLLLIVALLITFVL